MNLTIAMVDPIPYNRYASRSLCESIDCEFKKNSQSLDSPNQNLTYGIAACGYGIA